MVSLRNLVSVVADCPNSGDGPIYFFLNWRLGDCLISELYLNR